MGKFFCIKGVYFNALVIIAISLGGSLSATIWADSPTGDYFTAYKSDCPEIKDVCEANLISCHEISLKKANQALEALLDKLMRYANDEQKACLIGMQGAWGNLKKAQCGLVKTYYQGVTCEKWTSKCEAAMTQKRVLELQALGAGILWEAQDNDCPCGASGCQVIK